jgi:uncharacterized lipoprotein YmbA
LARVAERVQRELDLRLALADNQQLTSLEGARLPASIQCCCAAMTTRSSICAVSRGCASLTQLSLGSDAERPALASLSGLDTLETVETLDLAGFPLLRNFVGLAALRQVLPALPGPVPTRSRSNKCRPRTLALACASSPEPQVYALFPQRGSASRSQPWQVQLRRPGLPSYLDRPEIVWRQQPGKLEFSAAARWGAPLEDLVTSTMAQNLAQRLPSAHVFTESGAISASPDVLVEFDILRFELTERGAVELVAQVAVHWPRTPTADRLERYALRRSAPDRDTEQLVTRMSELLAELANPIALSLRA